MSDLITNNLDFGTGDTYKLQDARVDSMYTNAQIDSAMGNKVDKVSGKGLSTEDFTTAEKTKLTNLTQPNNSTITIRQGGVVKGTFTVDSAQDITIDIDAGGGSVDAYTKAESDARYPSKTYFDADKAIVDSVSYNIELGQGNAAVTNSIAIGDDNIIYSSNILIGYNNYCYSRMNGYHCVVIGNNNEVSDYYYNTIIGSNIYNSVITQNNEVAIGYQNKAMSVLPSGEVYSRGDVTCDDGSGNRVSLRNVKTSLNELIKISQAINVTTNGIGIASINGKFTGSYPIFVYSNNYEITPIRANYAWHIKVRDTNGNTVSNTNLQVLVISV